jgi:hypothetical protein
MGFLVILGLCIIVYIGLGFVYMQQGPQQKELEDRILKSLLVVNKPLPSMEELQVKYDSVNKALTPMETPEALEMVVDIARKNGIDVSPEGGRFHISPPGDPRSKKMGERNYKVLSINDISAQAEYDAMLAFISDLASGATLKTLILKKVEFRWVQLDFEQEEMTRRAEFSAVIQAVSDMMAENGLDEIPNPTYFDDGIAVNEMAAFPDAFTTASEKGYTGDGTPLDGYLLYEHDLVTADNTSDYQSVDYIDTQVTVYYYTCEEDGTVRQFDGPDLEIAQELLGSEEVVFEIAAKLAADLYSRPPGG